MARKGGLLMSVKQPYFLTNEDWYYFDENEFRYKLTDKAPEEAVESYKQFYSDEYSDKQIITE